MQNTKVDQAGERTQYNIGQCAKVNMTMVRSHCALAPYVQLVRRAIRNGDGFVRLDYVRHDMAGISGNAFDSMLGSVEIPVEALIF